MRSVAGLLVSVVLSAAGFVSCNAQEQPTANKVSAQEPRDPNVLLIVTDDQRVGTLDSMPFTKGYFARDGVLFSNAFASTPLCCPSRASIMSGRYPHNHKARINSLIELLDHDSVLPHYLQQDGYQTAIAGKYFNGWNVKEDVPPKFDRWAIIDDSVYERVYKNFVANVDGTVVRPAGYSTSFISKKTQGFLRAFETNDDQPWFLYVAPFSAHLPFTPEKKYAHAPTARWAGNPALFEADRSDKPPWIAYKTPDLVTARAVAAQQRRTLMSADDLVRDVVEVMTELDEGRDTLAIFISDNGILWGEHGWLTKRVPYSASVEIPLMVRWPGRFPEGIRAKRLVMNIDVAPTVLEAAGIAPDAEFPVDGIPLFGAKPRREMLIEYYGRLSFAGVPMWASLRSKAFQYIEYYSPDNEDVIFREYYDLIDDPFQLVNLLGDGARSNDPPVRALSRELAAARRCSGPNCVRY